MLVLPITLLQIVEGTTSMQLVDFLAPHFQFVSDPTAWVALLTLIVLEVVLGIDNLIFISILTNKLPEEQRSRGRIGIGWR
jgi:predicted tellurium resistance membrane protein TerC